MIEHISDNSTNGEINAEKLFTLLSINTNLTEQELKFYVLSKSNNKQLSGEINVSILFADIGHTTQPAEEEVQEEFEPHQIKEDSKLIIRSSYRY